MTVFEKAKTEYNALMFSIGYEFCTIGTNFSEGTEGWTLRDMVSEAQYHLDCCYDDYNDCSDGRNITDYMDKYGTDYEDAKDAHEDWLKKTRKLRAFVNRYKQEALTTKCTMGHCSKFD